MRAFAVCEELETKMHKSGFTTQRNNKVNLSNLKISTYSKKLNQKMSQVSSTENLEMIANSGSDTSEELDESSLRLATIPSLANQLSSKMICKEGKVISKLNACTEQQRHNLQDLDI